MWTSILNILFFCGCLASRFSNDCQSYRNEARRVTSSQCPTRHTKAHKVFLPFLFSGVVLLYWPVDGIHSDSLRTVHLVTDHLLLALPIVRHDTHHAWRGVSDVQTSADPVHCQTADLCCWLTDHHWLETKSKDVKSSAGFFPLWVAKDHSLKTRGDEVFWFFFKHYWIVLCD